MSSSASCETHGRRAHRRACSTGLEVVPRACIEHRGHDFEEMDIDAVLARRPRGRAGRRAGPHQRARHPARQALAGRRGAARRRASTCITTVNIQHLESLNDVVERDHRGRASARPCPDEVVRARRPDRAGRHDPGGAASPDGPRQHLRRRRRSTRRWPTTSGSATSPPCASWRCCGSPTGSTTRWRPTAEPHGIDGTLAGQGAGRRGGDRRARRARRWCVGAPGSAQRAAGSRAARRARHRRRRPAAAPTAHGLAAVQRARWWTLGRQLPPGASATTSRPRVVALRRRARTPPMVVVGVSRAQPAAAVSVAGSHRGPDRLAGRRHRRARGHPRRRSPGTGLALLGAPSALSVRRRRCGLGGCGGRCRSLLTLVLVPLRDGPRAAGLAEPCCSCR